MSASAVASSLHHLHQHSLRARLQFPENSMELPCCFLRVEMPCSPGVSPSPSCFLSLGALHGPCSPTLVILLFFPSISQTKLYIPLGQWLGFVLFCFFHLGFYRTWHSHIANMHLLKDEPRLCLLDHWSDWLESRVKNSSGCFCSDHPHIFSQRQVGAEKRIKAWGQTKWGSNPGSADLGLANPPPQVLVSLLVLWELISTNGVVIRAK